MKFWEIFGEGNPLECQTLFLSYAPALKAFVILVLLSVHSIHFCFAGLETLSLRVERHVQNALALAQWLESHPEWSFMVSGLKKQVHTMR